MGSSSSKNEAGSGGGSGGRAAGAAAAAGREEGQGAALGRAEEPATEFAEASLAENVCLAATILHSALAATTRLDLRSVALGDKGLEMLEGNLYAAGNLERLDLSETGLGDEGAERLARIIIESTRLCETLRDLRLAGNNIGVRGAEALSKLMYHKCDFEIIDLSSNTSLSNDGAAGLFETAMISRPSQLRLAGCDLSDDVLDAIAKVIRSQQHPWTDKAFAKLYEKKTGGFRITPSGSLHRKLEIDLTDNSFSAPKLNNLAQAVTALERFCSIKVTLVESTDASGVLQPVAPRKVQSLTDVIRGLERQQITVEEPLSHRVPSWVSDPWASSVADIFEQGTTSSATLNNPLHISVVEVANDDGLTSRAFQVDKHLLRGDVLILFREEDLDSIRKNVLATRRRFSVEEIPCHEPPERALCALLLRTNMATPILSANLAAFPPSFGAANDTPSSSTSKRLAETDTPCRSPKKKKN